MSKHTKEPWEYYENDHSFGLKMPQGNKTRFDATPYAVFGGFEPADRDSMKDNARRIVACVNVCAGISTENLENNLPVKELAVRYNACIKQCDELLAALEAIQPFIPTTSASEGGASAYSANVRAADKVRAAIANAKP